MIVELDVFNGPLELLLSLIEKDKINIYDIPINHITESYLESINKMDKDADDMIDFIVLASTLIEIKSKMLLPKKEDKKEDPRDDLVKRLIDYKKMKEAVNILSSRKELADKRHRRLRQEIIIESTDVNLEEDIKLLKKAFTNLINESNDEFNFDIDSIKRDTYKVEDYKEKIKRTFASKSSMSLIELTGYGLVKAELITYFLAILDLVKNKYLLVRENKGNIVMILRTDQNG